jgi:hypothetical protein
MAAVAVRWALARPAWPARVPCLADPLLACADLDVVAQHRFIRTRFAPATLAKSPAHCQRWRAPAEQRRSAAHDRAK